MDPAMNAKTQTAPSIHDKGSAVPAVPSDIDIAVLIPCYNEEATIASVVDDFRKSLPFATIYVYDNNSTDGTVARAKAAGAVVRQQTLQGKGYVVQRMFADVNADVYILVDGDATYDASAAPRLVEMLTTECLDMVNVARAPEGAGAYRAGHRFGNWMLTMLVGVLFGQRFADMLSGYRGFSRRFVKSFPTLVGGFEIETELTVHALELNLPVAEFASPYRERPEGSISKLKTYSDGVRILLTIVRLLKAERPLEFFGFLSLCAASVGLVLAIPIVRTFLETGLVPRFPTAFGIVGLLVLAAMFLTSGIVLDTVTTGRRELKRLAYLRIPHHSERVRDGVDAPHRSYDRAS
jgi:hypothetical protein